MLGKYYIIVCSYQILINHIFNHLVEVCVNRGSNVCVRQPCVNLQQPANVYQVCLLNVPTVSQSTNIFIGKIYN